MQHNAWIYIFLMALTTLLIRVLPLTLIRKQLKNRFVKSFLHYVPYATLSVMTFPSILHATNSMASAIAALAIGIFAAWRGASLFAVAMICCIVVFVLEFFMC